MGSLSVCPSIKTAISGFSLILYLPPLFYPQILTSSWVEKQFVLHGYILYRFLLCKSLPSNPFGIRQGFFNFRIVASFAAIKFSTLVNVVRFA
jgi:hypothetical protein